VCAKLFLRALSESFLACLIWPHDCYSTCVLSLFGGSRKRFFQAFAYVFCFPFNIFYVASFLTSRFRIPGRLGFCLKLFFSAFNLCLLDLIHCPILPSAITPGRCSHPTANTSANLCPPPPPWTAQDVFHLSIDRSIWPTRKASKKNVERGSNDGIDTHGCL